MEDLDDIFDEENIEIDDFDVEEFDELPASPVNLKKQRIGKTQDKEKVGQVESRCNLGNKFDKFFASFKDISCLFDEEFRAPNEFEFKLSEISKFNPNWDAISDLPSEDSYPIRVLDTWQTIYINSAIQNNLENFSDNLNLGIRLDYPSEGKLNKSNIKTNKQTKSRNELQWTQKYYPKSYSNLLVKEETVRNILRWLKEFNSGPKTLNFEKILILSGPTGSGKTSLIKILTKLAGFPISIHSSFDIRSKELAHKLIRIPSNFNSAMMRDFAMGNSRKENSVFETSQRETEGGRGTMVVITEAEFLLSEVVNFILSFATTSQSPIALLCNSAFDSSLFSLRKFSKTVDLDHPDIKKTINLLKKIREKEEATFSNTALHEFVENYKCDIRAIIQKMQMSYILNKHFGKTESSFSFGKDLQTDDLLLAKHIINPETSSTREVSKKLDLMSSMWDISNLLNLLFENTLNVAKFELKLLKIRRLSSVFGLLDSFGDSEGLKQSKCEIIILHYEAFHPISKHSFLKLPYIRTNANSIATKSIVFNSQIKHIAHGLAIACPFPYRRQEFKSGFFWRDVLPILLATVFLHIPTSLSSDREANMKTRQKFLLMIRSKKKGVPPFGKLDPFSRQICYALLAMMTLGVAVKCVRNKETNILSLALFPKIDFLSCRQLLGHYFLELGKLEEEQRSEELKIFWPNSFTLPVISEVPIYAVDFFQNVEYQCNSEFGRQLLEDFHKINSSNNAEWDEDEAMPSLQEEPIQNHSALKFISWKKTLEDARMASSSLSQEERKTHVCSIKKCIK
eukprot:GHVP01008857.1.p1 GENE.GHVP01008857.1~~GHVP01008857.1.p1  ORF type:complete len:797 (+),score=152.33 GHVP01008857.1:557-2947(+)